MKWIKQWLKWRKRKKEIHAAEVKMLSKSLAFALLHFSTGNPEYMQRLRWANRNHNRLSRLDNDRPAFKR